MQKCIFIIIIMTSAVLAAQPLDVREFGAVGDGVALDSPAIQAAIDSCAAINGGAVVIPPGAYRCGTLILCDNLTLQISAGATLLASRDEKDYDLSLANSNRMDDPPTIGYEKKSLILADSVKNVTLCGLGMLDGQAEYYWNDMQAVDSFIETEIENARQQGVELVRAYAVQPRPALVLIANSQNIHIRDLSFQNPPSWTVHFYNVDHAVITGLHITSSRTEGINGDGLDIDGCRDVHISNCTINTGDDCICMKTTPVLGEPKPLENITVTNCTLSSTSCALKLGTETFADMRHVLFNNCVIRDSNRGIGIIVRDGATVSDIQFTNLTIECTRHDWFWWGNGDPIFFILLKRHADSKLGGIENILVKNVMATGQGSSLIQGFPGRDLQNIVLDNVSITTSADTSRDLRADQALCLRNLAGVQLRDCSFEWRRPYSSRWRQTVLADTVRNLYINHLRAAPVPDLELPILNFKAVNDARIHQGIAMLGTATWLQVDETSQEIQILNSEVDANGISPKAAIGHQVDLPK